MLVVLVIMPKNHGRAGKTYIDPCNRSLSGGIVFLDPLRSAQLCSVSTVQIALSASGL